MKCAINAFREAIGGDYVLTDRHKTKAYRTGYRSNAGECLAVLRPGTLLEMWRLLQIAVGYDFNILVQAANTSLTGGSTPLDSYDHDIVIINTCRLNKIHIINNGTQVICHAGSTLHKLEEQLRPVGRVPHSVIGSSCIGASVIGGICNNSGGALIERGPAYTEHSLFARIEKSGNLVLENHLGVSLGSAPEEILSKLENHDYGGEAIQQSVGMTSDHEYKDWVRNVNAPTPARYNADERRLKGASGCAGKLAIFAVRLDTFPQNATEQTFFIGSHDEKEFTKLRRTILMSFSELPVSAEYIDREAFKFTESYGLDIIYLIRLLGTHRLPIFFKIKETLSSKLDSLPLLKPGLIDRFFIILGRLAPNPISISIRKIAHRYEHLLILKVKGGSFEKTLDFLHNHKNQGNLDFHLCSQGETKIVELHRFAVAGAAVRYQTIHSSTVGDLLALDIALPRNTTEWKEHLVPELDQQIAHKLYYGHFMCQVFHQDYILKAETDSTKIKAAMLKNLEARGAKYPAEHNVGHFYKAESALSNHYMSLDPKNQFNPGIGNTSPKRYYED